MRYKVIYENNRGQRVNLSERPYFLNIEPILDYQWSYSEKEKRRGNIIAGFAKDIQSVDLTLHIMDANVEARDEAVDYFNNVIEADIYDGIAGRLIIGDWYTWGYIIASKNTKWQYGNPVVKKVVKLVREQENWYHVVQKANYGSEQAEELYNFIEEDIKTYEGADTNSLKSLTATINPKQAGSGDPSPDNVRPISGWESVEANVTGVNVFNGTVENGKWIGDYTTGEVANTSTNYNVTDYIKVKPNKSYYMMATGSSRNIWYDANKNAIPMQSWQITDRAKVITSPANARYIRFTVTNAYLDGFGLNYPATDTEYHAYQGTTYTTDLPETVYGGSLDVVNGVLTVDRAMVDLGTLDWRYNGAIPNGNQYAVGITDKAVGETNFICSSYMTGTPQVTIGYICGRASNTTIACNALESTANDFIASVSGQQLVYELAEPRTIQLTPKQVTTLLGENNVWADSGDVTVEYWDDAGRVKTASGSVVIFSKHNAMSGAGYDYPYDYMADAQSQKRIENPNSVPCDFSITIQGYVDRPEVQIGDNVIAFDLEVPYGAFLTVDSSKKTAIMTLANGEQVNVFGARDPDYYLFERIKEGKNTVTWNGGFLWEIKMLEERSEPRWHMD